MDYTRHEFILANMPTVCHHALSSRKEVDKSYKPLKSLEKVLDLPSWEYRLFFGNTINLRPSSSSSMRYPAPHYRGSLRIPVRLDSHMSCLLCKTMKFDISVKQRMVGDLKKLFSSATDSWSEWRILFESAQQVRDKWIEVRERTCLLSFGHAFRGSCCSTVKGQYRTIHLSCLLTWD